MSRLTPDITDAAVVRQGLLKLTFADGLSDTIERARTEEGFAEAYLDTETHTVAWPGGADLAPDTLYERVRTGSWPEPARAI